MEFNNLNYEFIKQFGFGDNVQQQAALYKSDNMVEYELLCGEELSYEDMISLSLNIDLLSEFFDVNAVVVTKYSNCCCGGLGINTFDAYEKVFNSNPVIAYDGVIGFSQTVDEKTAQHLMSTDIKTVLAVDYSEKALNILKEKPFVKLVKLTTKLQEIQEIVGTNVLSTHFGLLVQTQNKPVLNQKTCKIVSKVKPTTEQIEDTVFGWKITKHLKTNCAVVVKDLNIVGVSQGSLSLISATEEALKVACENAKDAVLVTNGVINSKDIIFQAVQNRIGTVVQSGISKTDLEMVKTVDKYSLSMVITEDRNHKY